MKKPLTIGEHTAKIMEINEQINKFGHPFLLTFLRDKKILKILTNDQLKEIARRYLRMMMEFYHPDKGEKGFYHKNMFQYISKNYTMLQHANEEQIMFWISSLRDGKILDMFHKRVEFAKHEKYTERISMFKTTDKKTMLYSSIIKEQNEELLTFKNSIDECISICMKQGGKLLDILPETLFFESAKKANDTIPHPKEPRNIELLNVEQLQPNEQRLVSLFAHHVHSISEQIAHKKNISISHTDITNALTRALQETYSFQEFRAHFFLWFDQMYIDEFKNTNEANLTEVNLTKDSYRSHNPIACALLQDIPHNKEFTAQELVQLCLKMLKELLRVIHPDVNTSGNNKQLSPYVKKLTSLLQLLSHIIETKDIVFMDLLQHDFFEKDVSTIGQEQNSLIHAISSEVLDVMNRYHTRVTEMIERFATLQQTKQERSHQLDNLRTIAQDISEFAQRGINNKDGVEIASTKKINFVSYEKQSIPEQKLPNATDIIKHAFDQFEDDLIRFKNITIHDQERFEVAKDLVCKQTRKLHSRIMYTIYKNPSEFIDIVSSLMYRYRSFTKASTKEKLSSVVHDKYFHYLAEYIFVHVDWPDKRKEILRNLLNEYYEGDKEHVFLSALLLEIGKTISLNKIILGITTNIDLHFFHECMLLFTEQARFDPKKSRKNKCINNVDTIIKENIQTKQHLYSCSLNENQLKERIGRSLRNFPILFLTDRQKLTSILIQIYTLLKAEGSLVLHHPQVDTIIQNHFVASVLNNSTNYFSCDHISHYAAKFFETHKYLYCKNKPFTKTELNNIIYPEYFINSKKTLKGSLNVLELFFKAAGNQQEVQDAMKLLQSTMHDEAWNKKAVVDIFSKYLEEKEHEGQIGIEVCTILNHIESFVEDEIAFQQIYKMFNQFLSSLLFSQDSAENPIATYTTQHGEPYIDSVRRSAAKYRTIMRIEPLCKNEIMNVLKNIKSAVGNVTIKSTLYNGHERVSLSDPIVPLNNKEYIQSTISNDVYSYVDHIVSANEEYLSLVLTTKTISRHPGSENLFSMSDARENMKVIGSISLEQLLQFESFQSSTLQTTFSSTEILSKEVLQAITPSVIPGQLLVVGEKSKGKSVFKVVGLIQSVEK